MDKKKEEGVMDLTPLMDVVRTLRSPGGCPWDQAQDHKSMRRELVEEVYELLEAIDDGDVKGIREELGDVLFQVVFHARLAEEVGAFTMQDVITDVSRKLIHRHPHVYGTVTVGSAEELLKNWDALKAEEKKERKSALDGIARDLPSLMRAYKLSNLIIFIQCQYISLFNHPAVEQSQRLGKEKQDDKHNGNACYETTASQYTFYYFFKKFLHKYLLIFCMQRNGADVKRV